MLHPSNVQFLLKNSVVQLCEEKCTLTHDRHYITLIIFDLVKLIDHHWALIGYFGFSFFFRRVKLGCLSLLKWFSNVIWLSFKSQPNVWACTLLMLPTSLPWGCTLFPQNFFIESSKSRNQTSDWAKDLQNF